MYFLIIIILVENISREINNQGSKIFVLEHIAKRQS
jgi:hypothetical protein